MPETNHIPRLSHLALFFVCAVLLYSIGNSTLPLIDRDEPRFAEASREMLRGGDFLIPHLNGDYRFDKPPLIYWCQVLAFRLLGDNDFAARAPSVLFAALAGVCTILWGSRIFGAPTGIWAGILFASCLQMFVHARAAVADMPMIFFFLLASWASSERLYHARSRLWWWVFYLSLGIGFLAKGPVALLPAFFSPLQAFLNRSQYRLNTSSACAGTLLVLAVIGAWGIPALIATHGEFLQIGLGKHVVQRSLQPMESHGAKGVWGYILFLPFYAITIFVSFAPWSVFLPSTIKRLRHSRGPDENYLIGAILVVVLVFTLIQTKLPHYVLPVFPMLAMLVAPQVRAFRYAVPLLAGTVVCLLAIGIFGFRAVEPEFLSKTISQRALPLITPETRTASINYDEQSLIWYLRAKTRPFHVRLDSAQFEAFMDQPGPALCVVTKELAQKLAIEPGWKMFESSGRNFARWKMGPVEFLGVHIKLPMPQQLDLLTIIKD
jgi:4-amino-4-deoxy-L-arabinose transferase-like glycosyltransferase